MKAAGPQFAFQIPKLLPFHLYHKENHKDYGKDGKLAAHRSTHFFFSVFLFLLCSRWLNTAFLTFMPKNILPVPLRQDGWGMCPVQEEPVPKPRPALIVLLAARVAPGTGSLQLGRGASGLSVPRVERRPARLRSGAAAGRPQ